MDKQQETLMNIAREHIDHFTTVKHWDEYAKKHNLPLSSVYTYHFGSWNNAKEVIGAPVSKTKEAKYTKEEIKEIIKAHASYTETREMWDKHAREHDLPSYMTIRKHFKWSEVKRIAGTDMSRDTLIDIARKHREHFTTKQHWREYARKHGLPSEMTYIRKFKGWLNAKKAIFEKKSPKED